MPASSALRIASFRSCTWLVMAGLEGGSTARRAMAASLVFSCSAEAVLMKRSAPFRVPAM
jgi:hypothetical protein